MTLAGESTKYSPGMAISIVSTFAMIGVLAGPPVIGWIAHALSLRTSFLFLSLAAILVIPVSKRYFKMREG